MCGLLEAFRDCHQVVPRHNGFHRPAFSTTGGTRQGGIVSPTLFNVVVYKFIRTLMAMTL